ncbi:MAG TPA: squalene synthase HpnC [Caulobacteraceae bacterium]|nr:squalene synthase HpnC [Caulobacteraceae bacterium]
MKLDSAQDLASGKGSTDENFPVASALIAPRHRPVVMAFYRFARAADDVSDNSEATPGLKLALLEDLRKSLIGENDFSAEGVALREALYIRGLAPRHPLDLLEAFRRDVTKLRYDDWDDLMDYCRYSASPVGRFVLDVHGEDEGLWPMNDALCSALQVINHLQDCGKDRRDLDRVYLPLDALGAAGIGVEALDQPAASNALRAVIAGLAGRTMTLLDVSRPFARKVKDGRLALEIGVIQTLAEDLCKGLMKRDPLSQTVHHSKPQMAGLALAAMARTALTRLGART